LGAPGPSNARGEVVVASQEEINEDLMDGRGHTWSLWLTAGWRNAGERQRQAHSVGLGIGGRARACGERER
jgi:hypothetical protein